MKIDQKPILLWSAQQTRTRMNLEIQQRGLLGQVLSRPKVLGTRIESKRCYSKAEAEEKDRFHHAAGIAHAIVSLPGGSKQKAQWVKGAAVPVAAVPVMSRLPALKELHKAQSSITAALTSAGHGRGGPLYTLFAGHTASLKFMVGAKTSQILLALYNDHDVRTTWNTNPKKTSGPIHWCLGPRDAVFHAERQGRTCLHADNQEALGHTLRDAWRASCWDLWRKKAAPYRARNLQNHSWRQVAASFEATRLMLNKIEPSLRSHAMAVICGHTVSEASWHGDVNKPRTERKTSCGFCHRQLVPDFEHVMWQCEVFHNRPVKPSSVVQSTLGSHDCH